MLTKNPLLLQSNLKMHKNGRLTSEIFPADQQGKVVVYISERFFPNSELEMFDECYEYHHIQY